MVWRPLSQDGLDQRVSYTALFSQGGPLTWIDMRQTTRRSCCGEVPQHVHWTENTMDSGSFAYNESFLEDKSLCSAQGALHVA